MAKVKVAYRPRKGSKFVSPGVRPGEERSVDEDEARRLVASGSWSRVRDESQSTDAKGSGSGSSRAKGTGSGKRSAKREAKREDSDTSSEQPVKKEEGDGERS